MDPLLDHYTAWPTKQGEIRQLGNFELKWDKTQYGYRASFYIRRAGTKNWVNETPYSRNSQKNPLFAMKGVNFVGNYGSFRKLFCRATEVPHQWGGRTYTSTRWVMTEEAEAFKKIVKADYQEWRKLRKALKDQKMQAEAAAEGLTLQEKYNKEQQHKKAALTVEATNLKLEILQHINKVKTTLEEAADKLENNTFDQSDASAVRAIGRTFGSSGAGIFPKMRKCASLLRQQRPKT